MRFLVDVNVWVALLDDAHIHNEQALKMFNQPTLKIATCALTENGVLLVLNLPGYAKRAPPGFELVRQKLALACNDFDHEFWPCSLSRRDETIVDWSRVMGHNQITDAYLLALAVHHRGALATFDHHVALSTVGGATTKNLKLL